MYGSDKIWVVTIVLHNVLHRFLHLQLEYMELWSLVKNPIYYSLFILLVCLCIHFDSGNYPMWGQYTIIDSHGVNNTVIQSVGYIFVTTQVPGCPIGLFYQSNQCAMWNQPNNWWWRHDRQRIFRVVFLVVEHGTTVSGYSWCQICRYPTRKIMWCMSFLLYVILSDNYGINHLEYETYACDFSL